MSTTDKLPPTISNKAKDLPSGWRWVCLGGLIREAKAGFACGERDPSGVIQLRMNNVDTRGNFVWDEFIRIPADKNTIDQYCLTADDVLFNNTNSTELVGKSGLFSGFEEPIVYSNHFTRLRTVHDKLLPAFLAAWLNHQWQLGVFANICNRWIGQSAVKANKLLTLDFPLPPLSEQKRIATILNEQMAAVDRARKAAEERTKTASSLYESFVRVAFDSDEAKAWPIRTLLDLCERPSQYGTSQKSNSNGQGIPMLGMYHIHNGRIRWENVPFVELGDNEIKKYLLQLGDLLFNRTNSAELVGKTAVYNIDKEAVFASYLVRFCLNSNLADPYFVSTYINSRHGRAFIERHMARAIGQVNISASTMHTMPMPIPNIETQRSITYSLREKQTQIDMLEDNLREEVEAINKIPSSILRRAFAGEF